jgi:hypothetical protein
MSTQPEQVLMAGGIAASTPGPAFHLIPTVALERIAERFQLGIIRKGDKAWNALSTNQACLLDKDFVIERISHIIHHALKLRDKLNAQDVPALLSDDDASAMAWGAIFLVCATEAITKDVQNEARSEPTVVRR